MKARLLCLYYEEVNQTDPIAVFNEETAVERMIEYFQRERGHSEKMAEYTVNELLKINDNDFELNMFAPDTAFPETDDNYIYICYQIDYYE